MLGLSTRQQRMRIDFPQASVQGGLQVKARTGAFADSLKEGDRVRVDVLSSEKETVVMKTEGGQIFKARLDTDAALSQGDKVLLEYSGKEGRLVFLSIIGKGSVSDEASAQLLLVRDFEDKSLAPFASKLAELHMAVGEETARVMRELVTQNPGMTLEEAAFMASNKLAGDDSLIKAALAMLSDGDKTDALLARLIALLTSPESVIPSEKAQSTQSSAVETPVIIAETTPHSAPHAPLSPGDAPLTDWLEHVAESVAGANTVNTKTPDGAQSPERTMLSDAQIATQSIISQSDTVLQSGNVIKNVEILQKEVFSVDKPDIEPQNVVTLKDEITPQPTQSPQLTAFETDSSALRTAQREQVSGLPQTAALNSPPAVETTPRSTLQNPLADVPAGKVIAELLANLPEFHGTPAAALERFSNMLLKTAKENSDSANGGIEKLAALLDRLFTRIEKNDKSAGERLRNAREELFARLALIEESVSRAAPPAKAEMIEQTRRLMEHVRLLNNIDQFIYLQLPVRIGEERKTAELYLFRKKNGKKIDPDNANILLALDLENMGHWEGLINIRSKDVSIQMEVRGEAEKEFFSDRTVMLHDLLAEAGFRLVNTGITYSQEETTPLTALTVLDRYVTGRSGVVDVTV